MGLWNIYQSIHKTITDYTTVHLDYTSLYIDLIDDYNQALSFRGTINDNVSGYTLPQIERFLDKVYGFYSLSEQLKANEPSGVTDEQIDVLLSQY